MSRRDAATVLPRPHRHGHPPAVTADEQHRQRHRDPGAAPPTHRPAAPDRQTTLYATRPGVALRPAPPPTPAHAAQPSPDRLPRHHPALAPRPSAPPPRPGIPPPTAGTTAHHPQHPLTRPPPGSRQPELGYRRVHGELATRGITVAPSTVWEILQVNGIEAAPHRNHLTWATFLRRQAQALLAADFFDVRTLTGTRLYVLALLEHATGRVRILGATAPPTAAWTTQMARNLVMDLHEVHTTLKYLIRDRDSTYTAAFDAVVSDSAIAIIKTAIQVSRMNAIMERWIRTCPSRTPRPHAHREPSPPAARVTRIRIVLQRTPAHRALPTTAPLQPLPQLISEPNQLHHLNIQRRDRLGGTLHEYHHAA
jgi:putative transposase